MKQVDRTKVCWSCEADVNYEATYCPFCGSDLLTSSTQGAIQEGPKQDDRFTSQSLQESLASLYKPPYSIRNRQGLGVPDEREQSSFQPSSQAKEDPIFESYETKKIEKPAPKEEPYEETIIEGGSVWPLLLLSIGLNLATLGILILFFSKNGIVRLEWSAHYWFLYLVIGLPLVYFGIRSLRRLHRKEH